MTNRYPLVVIGAGPAGMSAACTVAEFGVEVLLLDDQASPGGQIFRNVSRSKQLLIQNILGSEYHDGKSLVEQFLSSTAQYLPESTVWGIGADRHIDYLRNDCSHHVSAEHLILTCGSQERPMPFPGWELPGVMTAGAAQIMLKSQAMVPESAPVLAGSGPLLFLLASQYLNAGLAVKAIVDTTPHSRYLQSMKHLPGALFTPGLLCKGLGLLNQIRKATIPFYRAATDLRVTGESRVQQISFLSKGRHHQLDTKLVLVHQGITPQLQLAKLAGCDLNWLDWQDCWSAEVDPYGEGNIENIYIAGDGQQINGAELAAISGRLSGLSVLRKLGRIDQSAFLRLAKPLLREKNRSEKSRKFIDAIYRPADEMRTPSDETIICRCEEISAGTIRHIARQGCQGPNQAKAFSRCGMGHCQGRFCESTVAALIAEEQNRSMDQVGYYRVRPPIKPLTLGQLARADTK